MEASKYRLLAWVLCTFGLGACKAPPTKWGEWTPEALVGKWTNVDDVFAVEPGDLTVTVGPDGNGEVAPRAKSDSPTSQVDRAMRFGWRRGNGGELLFRWIEFGTDGTPLSPREGPIDIRLDGELLVVKLEEDAIESNEPPQGAGTWDPTYWRFRRVQTD